MGLGSGLRSGLGSGLGSGSDWHGLGVLQIILFRKISNFYPNIIYFDPPQTMISPWTSSSVSVPVLGTGLIVLALNP